MQTLVKGLWVPERLKKYNPVTEFGRLVKECAKLLPEEQALELLDKVSSVIVFQSKLYMVVFRNPDSPYFRGDLVEDYGLVSEKLVTTAGVNQLALQIKNAAVFAGMTFHALGTGTTAEAITDVGLVTEWAATDYTGGVRPTGTLSNSSANVVQSVATNTKASAGTTDGAVTEHGVTSSATQGATTLWDRSVFTVINLAAGDSLQSTYQGTFAAGG